MNTRVYVDLSWTHIDSGNIIQIEAWTEIEWQVGNLKFYIFCYLIAGDTKNGLLNYIYYLNG